MEELICQQFIGLQLDINGLTRFAEMEAGRVFNLNKGGGVG
jgi:hypothetical protein